MANTKPSCLRKGVAVGRIVPHIDNLYLQIFVFDEVDRKVSSEAVKEIKKSIGAIGRNFRSSKADVEQMKASVNSIAKGLRSKDAATRDQLKSDLRQMQTSFRKAVNGGYGECGAKIAPYDLASVMEDRLFYQEMREMKEKPSP